MAGPASRCHELHTTSWPLPLGSPHSIKFPALCPSARMHMVELMASSQWAKVEFRVEAGPPKWARHSTEKGHTWTYRDTEPAQPQAPGMATPQAPRPSPAGASVAPAMVICTVTGAGTGLSKGRLWWQH